MGGGTNFSIFTQKVGFDAMATERPPEMLQVEVALPSGKRTLVKLVKLQVGF